MPSHGQLLPTSQCRYPAITAIDKYGQFNEGIPMYALRSCDKMASTKKWLPRLLIVTKRTLLLTRTTGECTVRRLISLTDIQDVGVEQQEKTGFVCFLFRLRDNSTEPDLLVRNLQSLESKYSAPRTAGASAMSPLAKAPHRPTDIPLSAMEVVDIIGECRGTPLPFIPRSAIDDATPAQGCRLASLAVLKKPHGYSSPRAKLVDYHFAITADDYVPPIAPTDAPVLTDGDKTFEQLKREHEKMVARQVAGEPLHTRPPALTLKPGRAGSSGSIQGGPRRNTLDTEDFEQLHSPVIAAITDGYQLQGSMFLSSPRGGTPPTPTAAQGARPGAPKSALSNRMIPPPLDLSAKLPSSPEWRGGPGRILSPGSTTFGEPDYQCSQFEIVLHDPHESFGIGYGADPPAMTTPRAGALITRPPRENSPAEKAGFPHAGRIVAVNNVRVANTSALVHTIQTMKAQQERVYRFMVELPFVNVTAFRSSSVSENSSPGGGLRGRQTPVDLSADINEAFASRAEKTAVSQRTNGTKPQHPGMPSRQGTRDSLVAVNPFEESLFLKSKRQPQQQQQQQPHRNSAATVASTSSSGTGGLARRPTVITTPDCLLPETYINQPPQGLPPPPQSQFSQGTAEKGEGGGYPLQEPGAAAAPLEAAPGGGGGGGLEGLMTAAGLAPERLVGPHHAPVPAAAATAADIYIHPRTPLDAPWGAPAPRVDTGGTSATAEGLSLDHTFTGDIDAHAPPQAPGAGAGAAAAGIWRGSGDTQASTPATAPIADPFPAGTVVGRRNHGVTPASAAARLPAVRVDSRDTNASGNASSAGGGVLVPAVRTETMPPPPSAAVPAPVPAVTMHPQGVTATALTATTDAAPSAVAAAAAVGSFVPLNFSSAASSSVPGGIVGAPPGVYAAAPTPSPTSPAAAAAASTPASLVPLSVQPLSFYDVHGLVPSHVLASSGLAQLLQETPPVPPSRMLGATGPGHAASGTPDQYPELFFAGEVVVFEVQQAAGYVSGAPIEIYNSHTPVMALVPSTKLLLLGRWALYVLTLSGELDRCVPLKHVKDCLQLQNGVSLLDVILPQVSTVQAMPAGRSLVADVPWLAFRTTGQHDLLISPQQHPAANIRALVDAVSRLAGTPDAAVGQHGRALPVNVVERTPEMKLVDLFRPVGYVSPWVALPVCSIAAAMGGAGAGAGSHPTALTPVATPGGGAMHGTPGSTPRVLLTPGEPLPIFAATRSPARAAAPLPQAFNSAGSAAGPRRV